MYGPVDQLQRERAAPRQTLPEAVFRVALYLRDSHGESAVAVWPNTLLKRAETQAGMADPKGRPALGTIVAFATLFSLGLYFTFASVQGDFGLFKRVQIEAEAKVLEDERARLAEEVALLENKTRRLSNEYLDLDLLDQQARDVLGLIRPDELALN